MPGKPDAALAARLRELQVASKISYAQMSHAFGFEPGKARYYANGKIPIPTESLRRIASYKPRGPCSMRLWAAAMLALMPSPLRSSPRRPKDRAQKLKDRHQRAAGEAPQLWVG
jgi:hypothetical protein